jgi:hypothetical protein
VHPSAESIAGYADLRDAKFTLQREEFHPSGGGEAPFRLLSVMRLAAERDTNLQRSTMLRYDWLYKLGLFALAIQILPCSIKWP